MPFSKKIFTFLIFSIFPSLLLSSSLFSCSKKSEIRAIGNDGKTKKFICNIQDALEFVHKHKGGIVSLSASTFTIGKQLVIHDNTTLEGVMKGGKVSTIRLKSNAPWRAKKRKNPAPALIVNSANIENLQKGKSHKIPKKNYNITIKNLSINGNSGHQKPKWDLGQGDYVLISFMEVEKIKISNVTLFDGLDDGIFIKHGKDISITYCNIKNMGHSGIFQVEVEGSVVENNTIDVHVNSGIRFFGGTNFMIRNNNLYSTKGYGNYGIQISQAYSHGFKMKDVLIEKNIIKQMPNAGIALYASRKDDYASAVIRNNLIYQCGSKSPNMSEFPKTTIEESGGINIQSFSNVIISQNTLFNNHGSAIWLDNQFYASEVNFSELQTLEKSITIRNNIIVGSQSEKKPVYGIEKYFDLNSSGSSVNIYNNLFYNNQNGAFSKNIVLKKENLFDTNPYFKRAKIHKNLEKIYKNEKMLYQKFDFRLENNSSALNRNKDVIIGISKEMQLRAIE